MVDRVTGLGRPRVLVIDDKLAMPTLVGGRAVRALVEKLNEHGVETVESTSFTDGRAAFLADASFDAVLVDWTAEKSATETLREGEALLTAIRERNANVPVILLADRLAANTLNVDIMTKADEYVFTLEDTVPFIAARVMAAIQRYTVNLLPPFNKALLAYMDVAEYVGRTGPPGWHRLHPQSRWTRLLRLLRREPVPYRQRCRARFPRLAARAFGPNRRGRSLRGPGFRRAPLILRADRDVGLEPDDHRFDRRRGPLRPV